MVAVFALCLLGAALLLHLLDREPDWLVPEWRNLPPVQEDQNAYTLIKEAETFVPNSWPKSLFVDGPRNPGQKTPYRATPGSIARSLNIARPDNDPEFLAFLHQYEPALAKIRASLDRPDLRFPGDSENKGAWWGYYCMQMSQYVALARAVAVIEGHYQEGTDILLDLWRFNLRLQATPGAFGGFDEQIRYGLWTVLRQAESPALLEDIQRRLQALYALRPERAVLFKKGLWALDNRIAAGFPTQGNLGRRANRVYSYFQALRTAHFIRLHKDELLALAEKPFPKVRNWFDKNQAESTWGRIGNSPYQWVYSELQEAAYIEARAYAIILFAACERYRRDNTAYPAALETLVPRYLEQIEDNPISEKPYLYAVEQGVVHIRTSDASRPNLPVDELLPGDAR